eukprot:scaffold282276_cov27-Tisochrysis_lutea.AAC.3
MAEQCAIVRLGQAGKGSELHLTAINGKAKHPRSVDAQDLLPPIEVRCADAYVDFHPPRSKQRGVNQLRTIGHADNEHVVEGLDTVHLGKELRRQIGAVVSGVNELL